MTVSVRPSDDDVLTALRAFILTLVPPSFEVVDGQDNRVPEPSGDDYIVMTPTRRTRLSTNRDDYVDDFYVGSFTGTTMVVTEIGEGAVKIGATVFGVGVAAGTVVISQLTGPPGGVGTYTVTTTQTLGPLVLASGDIEALQPVEYVVQLDVHSADLARAGNYAQIVATMLRDDYGVSCFASSGFDVVPLFADDPRQVPFINDQDQYETRWIVEAHLQANQVVVGIPQQFADKVAVGLIDVDAVYPP